MISIEEIPVARSSVLIREAGECLKLLRKCWKKSEKGELYTNVAGTAWKLKMIAAELEKRADTHKVTPRPVEVAGGAS